MVISMLLSINGPLHWAVSGFFIALILITLIYLGKTLGASSVFRTICAAGGAGKKVSFFNFNWRGQYWNVLFIIGVLLGGFISERYLTNNKPVAITDNTIQQLEQNGFSFNMNKRVLLPEEI